MTTTLDARTWSAWAVTAMLPIMMGRNPWLIAEVLLIVSLVRTVWVSSDSARGWNWFLRIAVWLAVVSVIFNVLTVRVGDRVLFTLPHSWPVIGGAITLNAVVYGIVSGAAVLTLILIGVTLTGIVSWLDLVRYLPSRLATVAVTGSVAFTFLPGMAESWGMIREARVMRGERIRGARDVLSLVSPLLATSLERALLTAEVLEARGFGASATLRDAMPSQRRGAGWYMAGGIVLTSMGVYCMLTSRIGWAVACLAAGCLAIFLDLRLHPPQRARPTRLRESSWKRADTIVLTSAIVAFVVVVVAMAINPTSLTYSPYPELEWPIVNLPVMIGLASLIAPVFLNSAGKPS